MELCITDIDPDPASGFNLMGWVDCDSDFARDPATSLSVTGYVTVCHRTTAWWPENPSARAQLSHGFPALLSRSSNSLIGAASGIFRALSPS